MADLDPRSAMGRGSYEERRGVLWGHSAVVYAKTAEPIEMPFGLWTQVGRIGWTDLNDLCVVRHVYAYGVPFGIAIRCSPFAGYKAPKNLHFGS